MKDFADDNFKFDENGRKLFKPVENTVGKGEIARYEQFLIFQQCFQKACFPGVSKGVIVWEWVKSVQQGFQVAFTLIHYHTIPTFNDLDKEAFWKHGKRKKNFYPSQNKF